MKLVFGVAFWMMASVVNATPVIRDHGFVVPKDVSLIPVRVCPPSSDRPAIYALGAGELIALAIRA